MDPPKYAQAGSSVGYPGPPSSAKSIFFHRLNRSWYHNAPTYVRYTPHAWYLGQFGFMGYFETSGGAHDIAKELIVGVYMSNAQEDLQRAIRCRVSLLDMRRERTNDYLLINTTMRSVEDWGRGTSKTIKFKNIPECNFQNGDLVFRFTTEWC